MIGAMKRPVCLFLIAVCKTRDCYGSRMITVFGFPGRRFPCYRSVRKVLHCGFRKPRLLICYTDGARCLAGGIMRYQPYVQTAILKEYYFRIRGKT